VKRGNTALKRVVSVASVAGMALALAVVAAPAASAAVPTDVDSIRATPIADAGWIKDNALITKVTDYAGSTTPYSTSKTGAVPVVGVGTGQDVSSIQLLIPSVASAAAFSAGNSFVVSLSSNATFTGTPTVDISRTPVNTTSLDTKAGWAGSNSLGTFATEAAASTAAELGVATVNALSSNRNSRISGAVENAGQDLKITLNQDDPNTAGSVISTTAAPGYLVTISNVQVTTKDGVTPGAIDAIVNDGAANHVTTIGYVSPFTVSIGDSDGYPNAKGDVTLPAVTVAETSKAGFSSTGTYTLTVSGDQADSSVALGLSGSTTVTTSATVTAGAASYATAGKVSTTLTAADPDKVESLTFSDLKVSGLKAGADVKLTLTAPAQVATVTSKSTWSNTPDAGTNVPSVTVKAMTTPPRLAGDSRYATAADIAVEYRAAEGASNAVVLANGIDAKLGIDALAANYLAGAKGAAILLTDSSDTLPQATQDALVTLLKGSAGDSDGNVTIYVMGKTDSVSEAAATRAQFVAEAAVNSGVTVKTVRLDGDNRYETAAQAVAEAGTTSLGSYNLGSGSLNTAFLASGTVNADALAAGALSAGAGIPVLLTDGTTVNDSIAKVIEDQNIKQLIVLGSTDRVSEEVIDSLKADNGVTNVVRVAGTGTLGRYDTAADLNTLAFKAATDGLGLSFGGAVVTAYLANGAAGFPDALTVGPLAGLNTNPLLTVPTDELPSSTKAFLTTHDDDIDQVTALGQSDRIEDSVITAAQDAIGIK